MIGTPRPAALAVACPWCGAAPDQWCARPVGHHSRSRMTFFVHPSRFEVAVPVPQS